MKLSQRFPALGLICLLILAGCANGSRAIDSFCLAYEPIYMSRKDTEETKRLIDRNNAAWVAACERKKAAINLSDDLKRAALSDGKALGQALDFGPGGVSLPYRNVARLFFEFNDFTPVKCHGAASHLSRDRVIFYGLADSNLL